MSATAPRPTDQHREPHGEFAGRTVVITGAAGGIGSALAHLLAADGAALVLHDLFSDPLEALAAELPDPELVDLVVGDAGEDGVIAEIAAAAARRGGVDGLAPAAGIYRAVPLEEMDLIAWRDTMRVNLDSVFLLVRALLPHLRDGASIVNFSSVAGERGSAQHAHYAASKGALVSFTRSLAIELGPRGIRANCVAPGIIATTMTDHLVAERGDSLVASTPLRRLGKPSEIAEAVRFLLSDRSSFITGAQLDVNGGLHMSG